MHVRDHARSAAVRRLGAGQRGYAMAALLVALNIMAIMLTVALPLWTTMVKREKEAELIFRGGQYARAINLFRQKYANAYPPNLDILINEKFLRKKYKDPMTADGEFQLLYAAQQSQRPGMPPTAPQPEQQQAPVGPRGGITGVVSKSKEGSLRLFNGRAKYNEWTFTPELVLGKRAVPTGGQVTPGTPGAPGGSTRPGMALPGGMPGTGRPGTGFPQQPGVPRRPPE